VVTAATVAARARSKATERDSASNFVEARVLPQRSCNNAISVAIQ
jgi:hypothetical protein